MSQNRCEKAIAEERERQITFLISKGFPKVLGMSEEEYCKGIPLPYLNRESDEHFSHLLLVDRRLLNSQLTHRLGFLNMMGVYIDYAETTAMVLNWQGEQEPEVHWLPKVYWLLVHDGSANQNLSVEEYRGYQGNNLRVIERPKIYERPLDLREALHLCGQFPTILENHDLNIAGSHDFGSSPGAEYDDCVLIRKDRTIEFGLASQRYANSIIPTSLNIRLPAQEEIEDLCTIDPPHGGRSFKWTVLRVQFLAWIGYRPAFDWLEYVADPDRSYTEEQKAFARDKIEELPTDFFIRR